MMIIKKSDRMVEVIKEKASKRQSEILRSIMNVVKAGGKVSFYGIQKITGASKSYLYGNETIRTAIEHARDKQVKVSRSKESKDVIIKALKIKVEDLEREIIRYQSENSESYKCKYNKAVYEINELKKQLRNSYKY